MYISILSRNSMKPIVDAAWLAVLENRKQVLLIDARSGPGVHAQYQNEHLAGASHADLEKDLSNISGDAAKGGRHPLPSPSRFGSFLGRLGITPETHVVVYDDKSGANAAARFWWMMKAVGHDKVQVIDGGYQAAVEAGLPVSSGGEAVPRSSVYPVTEWVRPLASIENVDEVRRKEDYLVIDVREPYRYRGESEPIDPVAGHIPGAVNVPYLTNLDDSGRFLSAEELSDKYTASLERRKPENVIVHCGSGVTACHTLLALEQAGIKGARLYIGSWSEWCRNNRPIAVG